MDMYVTCLIKPRGLGKLDIEVLDLGAGELSTLPSVGWLNLLGALSLIGAPKYISCEIEEHANWIFGSKRSLLEEGRSTYWQSNKIYEVGRW